MTTVANPYDTLYTKLKNRLTVIHENREYTVGEYMLAKASNTADSGNLPIVASVNEPKSISSILDFVNEKLTVKTPAKKEKTIRRFPLRTSASALLSAAAACALVVSCGIYALVGASDPIPYTADANSEEVVESEVSVIENDLPEVEFQNFDN